MDKKFLKEQGLIDAQKQFKKLYEYTFIGADDLTNEDEDDDIPSENGPQMDNSMNMPNNGDMSGQNMDMQGNQNINSEIPPQGDDSNTANGVEGFNPEGAEEENVEDINIDDNDVDIKQEDDEVIDVDDLTNAQEETDGKVSNLSVKFDELLAVVDKFDNMINNNNSKIDDLKAEIEKRNPTQIEKLSMQTQNSYPFNVTPEQYWSNKEKTSNYRTDSDNNGQEQGQYVITKDDINGDTDWRGISKSLDDDDLHQNLSSIFNY